MSPRSGALPVSSSLGRFRPDIVAKKQLTLFGADPGWPEGFKYQAELVQPSEEEALLQQIRELPFKEFEFQGFIGKRRVVSYGWRYDFNERVLRQAQDIPEFLVDLRRAAGRFAEMLPEQLQQVLVTEYGPGASIGWHRDKPMFGEVVGISLLSSCRFRFRRKAGSAWERVSLTAEPRSAYLLSGPSRTEWEHSIPAVDALRYSITFRNFRDSR
jgi:alkylated DNA repair dioxygenase AlkB